MALDSTELREYTHTLLSHFARLLKADFAPWLAQAVAAALESCAQVRIPPPCVDTPVHQQRLSATAPRAGAEMQMLVRSHAGKLDANRWRRWQWQGCSSWRAL